MHKDDQWWTSEIRAAADEAYSIQGNIEDAIHLLEDHMGGAYLEYAENYLEDRYNS